MVCLIVVARGQSLWLREGLVNLLDMCVRMERVHMQMLITLYQLD